MFIYNFNLRFLTYILNSYVTLLNLKKIALRCVFLKIVKGSATNLR